MIALLVGRKTPLPEDALLRFPELALVRLRRGGLPPRIGGWCLGRRSVAAVTFFRTVWLARGEVGSAELLLHELCHVHQFQTVPAFPIRYLWETLRRGYYRNRFEVAARAYASEQLSIVRREPQA